MFSAALCRGLIEASNQLPFRRRERRLFSAALCRGLIEARAGRAFERLSTPAVFRGFMPRPH